MTRRRKTTSSRTHYVQEGILPVFLVITNDGDKPISVTKLHAQLVTANRSKLEASESKT